MSVKGANLFLTERHEVCYPQATREQSFAMQNQMLGEMETTTLVCVILSLHDSIMPAVLICLF